MWSTELRTEAVTTSKERAAKFVDAHRAIAPDVHAAVEARLKSDSLYAYYFKDVTVHVADGVLTLRGRVPNFYLKQMLQTKLRDVEGVMQIENLVDVISATGLSSVRPK